MRTGVTPLGLPTTVWIELMELFAESDLLLLPVVDDAVATLSRGRRGEAVLTPFGDFYLRRPHEPKSVILSRAGAGGRR